MDDPTHVLIDRLARIEVKLDMLAAARAESDTRYDSMDKRMDRVERFMWVAVGIAMASGATNLVSLLP